jgi:predicted HTH domain antitoxin
MTKIILEISDEITAELRIPPDERLTRVRTELAIRLYQKGILSFGKARELSQISKWEFHSLLGQENIERSYDIEELESDLEALEKLP